MICSQLALISLHKANNATIMGDPFIQSYIGDLLRSLRTSYLIDLIKPYTRLELTFLARVSDSVVWKAVTSIVYI